MKVIEIFNSIEGEGKRAGELSTFIRLAGCNLRCPYCDTKYSWDASEATEMSVEDIIEKVDEFNCGNVTITGGEPLIHSDIRKLLGDLAYAGYSVNVETNGSIDISNFRGYSIFFTVDYKGPSSGQEAHMCLPMFKKLKAGDVLKFVVGTQEDLDRARLITELLRPDCLVYVSTVFGELQPAEVVEYMQQYKLNSWRLQLQMHKYIWDPDKRGV